MTTTDPIIGALAPWFGGKRTLASAIVAELGPHTQYFEPFAGGWPQNWLPLGANQPARYLIADDEPWTPQWSRLARATGYKPLVMPHRFVEAAR